MTFDYPGYDLKFIQKQPCGDSSAHRYSLVYTFYSPATRLNYVVRADYHDGETFAIKFYCKKDKRSDKKYSKIINRGDLGNIIVTCAKLVPLLLKKYPLASFAFGAARSVDKKSKTVEPYIKNQRFEVYRYFASQKFGHSTFAHFEYPEISCYMLVNRKPGNIITKEEKMRVMFSETYMNLLDI